MRGELATLRVNVDQLRSTDILMLWGDVPLLNVPASISPMMPRSKPPLSVQQGGIDGRVATDEDERVVDELVKETDEDELKRDEDEHGIVQTLTELEDTKEMIVQATLERSIWETSATDTSGVSSDSTIPPSDVQGTNAQVDVTLLPQVILFPGINASDDVTPPEIPPVDSTPQA
uniref:Polyprotein protein n=1 Tax=Solanum tuberosum TaxID=4113 RepID=M1DQK3_SOLTU